MAPPSALRQRTLTSLVLGPAVLAAVLCLPTAWLAAVLALVVVLGAWEWTSLAGLDGLASRLMYLGLMVLGLAVLWLVHTRGWGSYLLAPVVFCWAAVTLYLARVTVIVPTSRAEWGLLALGLPVLLGPWLALIDLESMQPYGPLLVLSLLVLIWGADIAAYFAGRRWGHIKLAPILSPGKTWAGGYGALAAGAGVGLVLAMLVGAGLGQKLALVGLCILTTGFSIIGDLFESLLKRRRGLKDSGRMLPGHGGMLDRIDSMTAAAPIFTFGLWMLL